MQKSDDSRPSVCSAGRRTAGYSYVLITPARNEAQFIDLIIESVVRQTIQPAKWVIVSDGSTDGTDELVMKYAAQHDWIELVRKPERKERHFAGKVEAFNAGYARVKDLEYEVIGNLDADVSFDDDSYFNFVMSKFAENPRLGVCGTAYREGNSTYPYRFTSIEDVAGACQMFRRECFEAIGGYRPVRFGGIDVIAVFSAQAGGWQTRTFTEKMFLHHRKVGSAQTEGVFRRLLHHGGKDYILGSHPAWELFRSVYLMKNKPYIVGGVLSLVGYLWAMLRGADRAIPEDLMQMRRKSQMQRLKRILRRYSIYYGS
jgi:glycosyltransferase involved in cell wall biosynthesis